MSTTFDLENLTPVEFKTEAKPLEDVFSMLLRKRTEFTPVQVEACGAATNRLRQGSFTSAINTAFSLHRELILSPDHLWLFLMQGFSNHINTHAETLRNCFVTHEGKKTMVAK